MTRLELYSASRKTARAIASIVKGKGRVRINNIPVEIYEPEMARNIILTPLKLAGDAINNVDINVRVQGGGVIGQAVASAMAISRALTNYKSEAAHPLPKATRESIKERILEYDKHLLSGDPRQVEPKKFGGPGARRRKQKSYR
ncbi:MAG: 30S ribosomal protein S9 [Candidatus Nitrosocaldaceae archaeon]|nr:MAG: 30S ribosomal protein S9 [Candidatus Nitrosocaldaceae archaeon]GIU72134.1 MAG: 30S ribosomal protein S9 [Candidatus Nitrosocaldaceae archaeon]